MKWSDHQLHLVSFDVPFPPNYGGVIDVFYKLKALADQDVRVHLHCFQYGRERADRLGELAASVTYYRRNVSKAQLFNKLPYIVISRSHEALIERLAQDNHPVLFEGLHSSFFVNDPRLGNRIRMIRTHNIEHDYYRSLARIESNIFKRYYYHNEAAKLETYESILGHADYVAVISKNDLSWFASRYDGAFYLPAFHANEKVQARTGRGPFAFYHGNLSVGENNEAALFLVNRVFSRLTIPLVVAGQRPSRELADAVNARSNVTLVPDPTQARVKQLLADAHVNVLPTFQPTGIKLKLLSALYNGRFCLANTLMVDQTGLESLCIVADTEEDLVARIRELFDADFEASEIQRREELLYALFSNDRNIRLVLDRFFPGKGRADAQG